jgi:hypothetical protein
MKYRLDHEQVLSIYHWLMISTAAAAVIKVQELLGTR